MGTWYDEPNRYAAGALYRDYKKWGHSEYNASAAGDRTYIDASKSNTIYGAGNTIRPISKQVIFMIRY